ncbi:MAG: hypothetical protein DMENIID0002_03680 [Rickettsia endosymbiont of Sergentomyia squamirostris]|uniref:Uncharacterized protein n=1 Tax=Candidatus Tisiphia endosymbiont of Sergentomyia squamirostris TaxID=3113639 RepID=A0AAT9G7C5_9RICK
MTYFFEIYTVFWTEPEFHQLYNVTIQDQDGKTVGDYAMEYCQESLPLLGLSEL